MTYKAKGLDRNRYRNRKKLLSLGNYQAAKHSVFSVLREARSNGQRDIYHLDTGSIQILLSCLTIKGDCFVLILMILIVTE